MAALPPTEFRRWTVAADASRRLALWPAGKALPPGWREVLSARSRADCLNFVERPDRAPAVPELGVMFFGGDEGTGARSKYRAVLETARFADANGFRGLWLPERHFAAMGSLYPSPAVLHAAVARETTRLRLRAGSVVLPLHDPLRVAEDWAVVDNLSDGRVEISFAAGWNAQDFALRPHQFSARHEALTEGLRTVQRLWAGEVVEAVDGLGRPVRVRTYPTPVQPRLTCWITTAGKPEGFRRAGLAGAHLLTHLFDQDVDALAEKIAVYRQARAEHGDDPATGRVAVALHTFLADDPAEVARRAAGPYREFLSAHWPMLAELSRGRGLDLDTSRLSDVDRDTAAEFLYQKFVRDRSLIGTPEGCAPLVRRLGEVGVAEIACLVDFGPPAEAILAGLPHLLRLKQLVTAARP